MIPYVLQSPLVLPEITLFVTLILFFLMWQLSVELCAKVYMPSTSSVLSAEREAALVERAIRVYGLDKPWTVQYVYWLRLLVTGSRGYSPVWRQPVLEGLLQRAPTASELLLASTVPCTALSLVLGSVEALGREIIRDGLMRASTCLDCGIPSFMLGPILKRVSYA